MHSTTDNTALPWHLNSLEHCICTTPMTNISNSNPVPQPNRMLRLSGTHGSHRVIWKQSQVFLMIYILLESEGGDCPDTVSNVEQYSSKK